MLRKKHTTAHFVSSNQSCGPNEEQKEVRDLICSVLLQSCCLSLSFLLLFHLLSPRTFSPLSSLCSTQRCNHIYSVMKIKFSSPSTTSFTNSYLSLVRSGYPFVITGTNKLCLLTQSGQERSLEWNKTESTRSEAGWLWLSEISTGNGYECLSLCVFTAVISVLCCE